MSSGVLTFGSYTFGARLEEFYDNFSDMVPRTQRLPGLDGGFSQDGRGPSQSAIGQVTVGLRLVVDDPEDMDAARDAIRALPSKGLQKLVYQPTDAAAPTRYCWARVNYIRMSQNKAEQTDFWQKVQIIFQVPTPFWYVADNWPWALDSGVDLDDGEVIGDNAIEVAASGASTSQTLTNDGTAAAVCVISVQTGASQTCENVRIVRVVNGAYEDRVGYVGVIDNSQELHLDGARGIAQLDGDHVYGGGLVYDHPAFLRLEPGANSIKILFKNGGDAATVKFWWLETFR